MSQPDYSSIDRLMEFGMSMAVAQQMVQSFNSMIASSVTPQIPFPDKSSAREWYYAIDGKVAGPACEQEVKSLLLSKRITSDTLMWSRDLNNWKPAGEIPQILNFIMQLPPAL